MARISIRVLFAATISILILAVGPVGAGPAPSSLWSDTSPEAIAPAGERVIQPLRSRILTLDRASIGAFLARTPMEGSAAAANRPVLDLPLPDGGYGRFAIVESPILAPELGAKYPEIRTYAGYGIDDPSATVRMDLTPAGFHALILSSGGSIYIDPFQRGDIDHYQSYNKSDFVTTKSLGGCTLLDEDGMGEEINRLVESGAAGPRSGLQMRTYRAAVAATGEYTAYQGGTVVLGLAAVTTSMNRVTGVYEREVSVRMELVANDDLLIYTNAATDPYTNNNGSAMLSQNQSTIDSVIGTANYDIGHVFSTGGGGVAYLGVVCRTGQKAGGVTGSPAPVGDAYDIDYVAHEMGHQFGSNHCFNGNAGSCSGGNRHAATAYEPGSGSTIMAYAGICGAQNLQPHSDDYFVWISLDEIVAYTTVGAGNGCPVVAAKDVVEPVVSAGTGGFTIPMRTPFRLTASATTTGAATYCWEESDLGSAGAPDSPVGNAPIFRSFDPVTSPSRVFPKISDLVTNHHTIGELLPTYARNLSFKVTVRDTQPAGVAISKDAISFSVAAVGPFLVTAPDLTAISWPAGSTQTVTWSVASTDIAPINCANVNILLSTDGGYTFPDTLAVGTPNDGSEPVTLPFVATTTARVKVEAAGNIFFDISNNNFTIAFDPATVGQQAAAASAPAILSNHPNPFRGTTTIEYQTPQAADVAIRIYDPAGRLVRTLIDGPVGAGRHEAVWDGKDASGKAVVSGMYLYELGALGRTLAGRMMVIR